MAFRFLSNHCLIRLANIGARSEIKNFFQSTHQRGTFLDLMAMQFMLGRYEGQVESLEFIQDQVEVSQKQRAVLSSILKRWPMRGLYRGVLCFMMLLVSFVGLPKLKPGLSQVLGGFFQLEITPSLTVIFICLLGCAEWLRRSSYVGFFSMWTLTFDRKHLQPEEVLQCMLKSHCREIYRAAGICRLADWLFIIVPMLLIPVLLLTIPSVSGFPVGEILVLPMLSLVLDRVSEPFRYAVRAIVYSNWRSQHWQEGYRL